MSQPDTNVLVSEARQPKSPASSPSDGTVTTRHALSGLRIRQDDLDYPQT
jgi:hypothetical protein